MRWPRWLLVATLVAACGPRPSAHEPAAALVVDAGAGDAASPIDGAPAVVAPVAPPVAPSFPTREALDVLCAVTASLPRDEAVGRLRAALFPRLQHHRDFGTPLQQFSIYTLDEDGLGRLSLASVRGRTSGIEVEITSAMDLVTARVQELTGRGPEEVPAPATEPDRVLRRVVEGGNVILIEKTPAGTALRCSRHEAFRN